MGRDVWGEIEARTDNLAGMGWGQSCAACSGSPDFATLPVVYAHRGPCI